MASLFEIHSCTQVPGNKTDLAMWSLGAAAGAAVEFRRGPAAGSAGDRFGVLVGGMAMPATVLGGDGQCQPRWPAIR
jgi:hypothetical protein